MRFYGNSYMNHPDHRAAADATLDAVFPSAGTKFIFPELLMEGLEPHEVHKVFIHGSEKPETYVDIASVLNVKIAALKEHRSQLHDWDPSQMIRDWAKDEGKERGMDAVESYRVMILKEEKAEGSSQ